MLNTRKLKGRMAEKGLTQKDIAEALGIATPTVNQKLNNVRPMDLTEAEQLAKILDISAEDFSAYFFANEVALRY